MRAFVAISLPEPLRAALFERQSTFRAACGGVRGDEIRWTRPEGIHLTLKFLGEISDQQVRQVTEALKMLRTFQKFVIELKGFGFFPDARRPRVFWAGVVSPPDLSALANRVEHLIESLGFTREEHAFTPHLTLARFKRPRPQPALEALIGQQGDASLGEFEVSEFFLFESRLSPRGAEYLKIARFPQSNRLHGGAEVDSLLI